MADMNGKQLRFINVGVEIAQEVDAAYTRIVGLMGDLFANEFNQGGANALTDDDFTGNVAYLDAAHFYALVNALAALQTAIEGGGNIQAIRRAKFE